MRRKLPSVFSYLLLLVLLVATRQTQASHAMGADLTYECVGGNTYKVRFSFYRDCIGINAPMNVYVNVRSASCGQNLGVTCNPIPGTGQQVTYLCPTATSTCNGGTFTGIQEWIYEGVITLPMQCTDWVFSYTLCCRNAAITTISTPGSNTFYLYANLDNTKAVCNSSPTFSNKPVPFACLGQELCFNHGATDADGDSLVYSLVDPKQTATTNVNYLAPYNASNPLNSSPAMQFNTQTGDICFTPQQLQVTVMAVLVQEFRNGQLIGSVVRDIQVTVLNCNNTLPTLSGINGTNNYDMTVCANDSFCFNVFSDDADAGQQLSVAWNNAIDSANFSSNSALHPTGTFCWKPTNADISNTPHCFTLRVNDDNCPYMGSQTYSYCITVNGLIVDAGPDQAIACSDLATVTANVVTGNGGPYTYLWSNGFTNPTQTVPVGTYVVTVSDGTCSATDTVQVTSAFEPTADFSWTGGCINSPVSFTDNSTSPGGISTWSWNFGDGSTSTLQNPTHTYSSAGTYQVTLVVENIFGCIDSITLPVTINPPPVASFTVSNACAGTLVNFTNTSNPIGQSWSWTFSNGATSTASDPSILFGGAGTYTGTLTITDSLGCTATVTQTFTINPAPVANFTSGGLACQNGLITFTDQSGGNPTGWTWSFGDGDSSNLQNPSHVYTNSGVYNVTLVVINANGCADTITKAVTVNAPPLADAGPDKTICLGSNATLSASGGVTYTWQPGGQSGSTITVSPSSTSTYTVTVTDANGCSSTDTVVVNVNPLPVAVVSPAQSVCAGQSVTLTASGGVTYHWNPSGSNGSTVTVTPSGSTTYAVDVIDSLGCQATAFINVTVHPNPTLTLPPAVFICSGISATLDAGSGASSYQWSTGATTQTIYVNTQGTYSVTITNQWGCSTTASTQVTVGGQVISTNNAVSICQGQTATLDAGYSGSTYQWSNGATTQTITVAASGSYQVTVTDPSGCSGTVVHTVQVNPLPVPNFTPVDVCITQPVQFVDISTVNGSTITSWSWNLGDGNVSFQQNPLHAYLTPGSYPIQLTVTSAAGCSASLTDTVNVYPLPVAKFNVINGCQGSSISFADQSTTGLGNINSWNWNFGDGTTSTIQNPTHVYATAGTYTVTLSVSTAGGCSDVKVKQVLVYPKPVMSFNPLANVCAGTAVAMNNNSTSSSGTINSWNWSFGDGTGSTAQNPTHVYNTPGTYTITLSGTNTNGCSGTTTRTITIIGLPVADAGSDASICLGSSATLTATGGPGYTWSNGSTAASITVSPVVNTTYYMTVTNASGCTSRDSVRVFVKPLPTANAGADKSICIGNSVTLTATGGGTYSWTPGGAATASIAVSPASTTPYIVTVTASNGCQKRDTVLVNVNNLPVASAGPDKVICMGSTATLTASGGNSYVWQHNGSTASTIYVNPTVPTSYIVTVTNAAGCSRKDTVLVSQNPVPVVSLSNAFFCSGFSTTLDAGNPGMTYDWSPGTDTTQTITVSAPGQYSVVVTNAFGCQGTGTANVVEGGTGINPNPTNVITCAGSTVTLNAANPGMTYLWSTGATTQTISVNTGGLYSVTVTDPGGCSTTFSNNVIFNPKPVVDFTSGTACFGNAVSFVNTSSISSGNIALWNWKFGNGNASNVANPSQNYLAPGTYTVTLIATSGAGCIDSMQHPVTIDPVPVADFTANTVCAGTGTQFLDASTIGAGGFLHNWTWNFGDGSTGNGETPIHQYAASGNYLVTLIVSTATGCSDTITYSVEVKPVPDAAFTANDACEGDTTQFVNTSSIQNGNISDVSWDFGDGTTSQSPDPQHVYAAPGTYVVSLTVGTSLACTDTYTDSIVVHPRPQPNFIAPPVCNGNAVNFSDMTTVSSGSLNGWFWTFGDGSFGSQPSESHLYNADGSYTVTMSVTSDKGCTAAATKTATVNAMPVADFTTNNVCDGSPVSFTDASTIANGTINTWSWNFGDGATSNASSPTHTYSGVGSYLVELVIASNNGCTDTLRRTVNVYPVPAANFASGNVCLTNQTEFFDQSSVSGGSTYSYNWNFGDSNNDTLANPAHTYQQAGTYNVSLTVTTPQGCSNTKVFPVTVYPLPVPDFATANVCVNTTAQFNDQSSINNSTISGWSWTLGDSTASTAQNPTHFYGTAGSYPVSLIVTSAEGCSAEKRDTIQIYELPTPRIASGTGCVGDPIAFADTSSGANNNIVSYSWDFGNGQTSTLNNPSLPFATAGTHYVTLVTTNANGCSATAKFTYTVSPLPTASFSAQATCANSAMTFTNTSSIPAPDSIVSYQWDFGNQLGTSTAQNPSYTYPVAGNYLVTLVVTSNNGCTDTVTASVHVNAVPVAHFANMDVAGCGPFPVQFTDSSYVPGGGNITGWTWDFGDGASSNLQDPLHVYSASGSYNVSLTVISDSGCVGTYSLNNQVTVYPSPMAAFTPDPAKQSYLNPNFSFINQTIGGLFYTWTFGDGQGSLESDPMHTYGDTGTYMVTLWAVNSYGCRDSVQHPVRVEPEFTFWIPNAFTPNEDGGNENFNVKGIYIAEVKLHIFNRWGQEIFYNEGKDSAPWDGSVIGSSEKAQEGTYVYMLEVKDVWGKLHEKVGQVHLIR